MKFKNGDLAWSPRSGIARMFSEYVLPVAAKLQVQEDKIKGLESEVKRLQAIVDSRQAMEDSEVKG